MKRKDERIAALRQSISEIAPSDAQVEASGDAVIIDVREPDEVAAGSPTGSLKIVRGYLEMRIEDAVPDLDHRILLICATGTRTLFAAQSLLDLGYTKVHSIRGGFNAWKQEGLPFEIPKMLSASDRERYSRHLLVPGVGNAGQIKLLKSKVLMVGAGGLGSPAAFYLAAAGIGKIGIIDDDVVDRSNLQRQILHTDDMVGHAKVESARKTLSALNPSIEIETYRERLSRENVDEIFAGYDVIVDGCDNFPTRYLCNDACVKHGIPNVHGSIFRFEGQVSVFWPGYELRRGPCYRCLFPEPPPRELSPSCAEAGVLGILPGVIGTLEAVETIKLILEIGEPLVGRLLVYDALQASFMTLEQRRNPSCAYCGDDVGFPGYSDYEEFCSS